MSDGEIRIDVWFLGGPHDGRGPVNVSTTRRKMSQKRFTYQDVEYRIWIGYVAIPDGSPTKRTYLVHPAATGLFKENT